MDKNIPATADSLAAIQAEAAEPIAGVVPSRRHLASGDALFRQGDPTFGIFRLVSGRLRMVRVTPAGNEVTMHTARPGELFAEASVFSPRYHCDAIAMQECEVLVYPKAQLVQQLREEPEALWGFALELAQRIHGLRSRLELRQIRSASERVLQALQLRCNEAGIWRIDGTLRQFAEEIGLTHEALYRALAALERQRQILRNDAEIRVLKC